MRLSSIGFSLAVALLAGLAIREAITAPIWSPRDEIAHFDFVDQLAHLRYPAPSDAITNHTADLCRESFEWYKPTRYDGSKESMGVAGWSYESQNPPLYYSLLAPLHRALKALDIGGRAQIVTLRVVGVLLFVTGVLLALPIFAELELSFDIPRFYGACLALVALTTNHLYVTSLGNDVLSIPLSGAAFLFALRFWRTTSPTDLFGLALAVSAASVTKLTNVPLLVLPLLIVIAAPIRSRGQVSLAHPWAARIWAGPLLALVPLLLYLTRNFIVSGSLLGSSAARDIFATFVVPVRPASAFLGTMVEDSFNLQSLGVGFRPEIKLGLATLLLMGTLQSIVRLARSTHRPEAALHLIAVAIAVLTMTTALILNELAPGVHWHVFRHYYAILLLWQFAFLALPLRVLHHATARSDSNVV